MLETSAAFLERSCPSISVMLLYGNGRACVKQVQLGARHAAERVLRLWGDSVGLTVDEAKKKVGSPTIFAHTPI